MNQWSAFSINVKRSSKSLCMLLGCLGITLVPLAVAADPPELQTPAPVIYLSDNLDEKDKLGWCIDTKGRGFSEQLHAHSCKPRGGDVQFTLNKETGQIVSATFEGKCATLLSPAAAGVSLGLFECSTDTTRQVFTYHEDSSEFRPHDDNTLCLVVGEASRAAGPFMSRNLKLAACDSTEERYKQWRVKE